MQSMSPRPNEKSTEVNFQFCNKLRGWGRRHGSRQHLVLREKSSWTGNTFIMDETFRVVNQEGLGPTDRKGMKPVGFVLTSPVQ